MPTPSTPLGRNALNCIVECIELERFTPHIQSCRSFSKGAVQELFYLKAWQIGKVDDRVDRSRDLINERLLRSPATIKCYLIYITLL